MTKSNIKKHINVWLSGLQDKEYYQRYKMAIEIGEIIDSSQRHCNHKYVCAY